MEREDLELLKTQINALDIEDKHILFQGCFSIGRLASEDFNDTLVLISLVALVYERLHKKDPTITHLKILTQISGKEKDDSGFYQFLESLALVSRDLSYGTKKIDACGLTTSQEIINKIKGLLNIWMPF